MIGWIIHFWLLKDTHFVSLEALTMLVNNTENIFLNNSEDYFISFLFIKYLWISNISLVSVRLKSTEKNFTTPFNPVLYIYIYIYILLIAKSFEILPKHGE